MKPSKMGPLFRGTLGNVNKHIESLIEPYGIGYGQFDYLMAIDNHAGINQNSIGEILNVGKAAVAKAVKILLNHNLITREIDKTDKRYYNLYITTRGREIIDKLSYQQKEIERLLFEGITDEEKVVFTSKLELIYENSKRIEEVE